MTPLAPLARGVNLSRWFRYPAEDSERHYRTFITDADLDLLVALGITSARLAVDPQYLHLQWLDDAVGRLTSRGLVVVVDYHDESRAIESGPIAVEALERNWSALATLFGRTTSPSQVLLEIFNEPVFDDNPSAWFPIRERLAKVIRAAAPLHTIVAGGPNWSSLDGLLRSQPLADDNVVYTFHFYEPFEFTHQGAPWVEGPVRHLSRVPYPQAIGGSRHVEQRVEAAAAWAGQYRVPVWAGEFGAYPAVAPRLDRLRWLYDVRTSLERQGIGWCLWSYDETLGLGREVNERGQVSIDWDAARALGLRTPPGLA